MLLSPKFMAFAFNDFGWKDQYLALQVLIILFLGKKFLTQSHQEIAKDTKKEKK
jgi:hypothetical protein